jgi:hypothetical protein
VLSILSQLDDEEILILDAYADDIPHATEKFQRLTPNRPTINSDRETRERYALFEAAKNKLERLSLLAQHIDMDRDAKTNFGLEVPKFDHFTGQSKGYPYITPLGRLLLRKIGIAHEQS